MVDGPRTESDGSRGTINRTMVIDWSGIFHILATPVTDDAALDLSGVPKLVESALATKGS